MPWARIDDNYFNNPKVIKAGAAGTLLHIASIAYSRCYDLDGLIEAYILPTLAHQCHLTPKQAETTATLLVDLNLWEVGDLGWYIHDYDQYGPPVKDPAKVASGRAGGKKSSANKRSKGEAND